MRLIFMCTCWFVSMNVVLGDRPFYQPAYQYSRVVFDCANFTKANIPRGYHFVAWQSPSGTINSGTNTTLVIDSVHASDAGKYWCLLVKESDPILNPVQSGLQGLPTLSKVFEIPYVIVPKDYVQATWVGLLAAGAFLCVCIGLMLLYRFTYEKRVTKKPKEAVVNSEDATSRERTNRAYVSTE